MKIQFKNIGFSLLILLAGIFSFSSCENESWNDHYSVDSEIVSGQTLWEVIQATPNLKKFAWALKKTGYDKYLSNSQMHTVWAPVDSASNNVDTTNLSIDNLLLTKEYVKNHISRYKYAASGSKMLKVTLLNSKVTNFGLNGVDYYFADNKLLSNNKVASNGLLHVIGKKQPFFDNLWEYLAKDTRLDSIRNYLYSFDKITFDASKSTPGDVNEQGETVYIDSVLYNSNKMFSLLGKLEREDSTYTAIWPTNTAWISSYKKIKEYYRYYSTSVTKYTADTLQRNNARLALVQDLVFSNTMQKSPNDSLVSTAKNVFYNPNTLVAGAQKVTASNGVSYITNELKYNHWQSWNQKILVEAEKSKGRTNTWSNLYERTYSGNTYEGISGKKYVEVISSTTSVNPTIQFEIPNILSGKLNADKTIAYGAAYNIYCVFVPMSLKMTSPKPNKVKFSVLYNGETGKVVTVDYTNNGLSYTTDKNKITKVLIASNVTFPFCEKGLDTYSVKVKVSSNVTAKETVEFTRDLLIDCIILEPVQ